MDNFWILDPMMRQLYPFLFSVEKYGLILPGGDEPQSGTLEIPFQSQEEIERSMSAIKRKMIRKKLKEMLPFGQE
jgi:arylsulfatase